MGIIIGFVVPVVLFLVTIPIKASLVLLEKTVTASVAVTSKVVSKTAKDVGLTTDDSKSQKDMQKIKNTIKNTAQLAVKATIRSLKMLIAFVRGTALIIHSASMVVVFTLLFVLFVFVAVMASVIIAYGDLSMSTSLGDKVKDKSTSSSISGYDDWFFVGDSRTVGMAISVDEETDSGDGIYTEKYCCKGSMGISWFTGDSMTEKREEIYAFEEKNIVFNLGVNGLDVDNYIKFYEELPEDFIENNNVIVMSVNPVNESIEAQNGYTVKNSDIEAFNEKVKDSLPDGISWLDTYSVIYDIVAVDGSGTFDGLHYIPEVYQTIHDTAMEFVDSSGSDEEDEDEDKEEDEDKKDEETTEATTKKK